MSNVIHRTTLEFRPSVNEPDYPEPTWKWDPDMSQVVGVDSRYWKWDAANERPIPMTAPEQAAVDSAENAALVTEIMSEVMDLVNGLIRAQRIRNNTMRQNIADILAAAGSSGNYNAFVNAMSAIASPGQITPAANRTFIRNKVEDIQGGVAE